MREARSVMAELAASGLSPDQLALVMELSASLAAEARPVVDKAAENKRAYDRDYQSSRRKARTKSYDQHDVVEPLNEDTSKPGNPQLAEANCPPAVDRVVEAWNKSGATAARGMPKARRAALKARLAEHGEAVLFEAIANLAASKFHCGQNDRGWKANLDWFLKPANLQKMLELAPDPSAKPVPVYPPEYTAAVIALAAERDRKQLDMGEYLRRHSALRVQFGIDDGTKAQPPPERRGGTARSVGSAIREFNIRNMGGSA